MGTCDCDLAMMGWSPLPLAVSADMLRMPTLKEVTDSWSISVLRAPCKSRAKAGQVRLSPRTTTSMSFVGANDA